jgi:hypothetical protein
MNKHLRIFLWVLALIVIIAGFFLWQRQQLGKSLRTVHAENAEDMLMSGMSSVVLAPDLGSGQQAIISEALLSQYQKDPNLIHQKFLLVTTWLHASQIQKATNWSSYRRMLDSETLSNIPESLRVDGWNNPFCIWVEPKQVVFISSGGKGTLECKALTKIASQSAISSHDARLRRTADVLVTVQPRFR